MKFEETFCSQDNRYYSTDEITDIFLKKPEDFASLYKNNLFCPVCKKAQLSYNNASTPYFKTYPHAEHSDDCDLRQPEMSSKDAEAFSKNPINQELIQRQMQSILENLLSMSPSSCTLSSPKPSSRTKLPDIILSNVTTRKRLARKRIDIPMREEDFDCVKYFYGPVLFQWEIDEKSNWKKILLRHQVSKHLLCRLTVSNVVYNYIADDLKNATECKCNIVFMATAQKCFGKRYFKAALMHSKHILVNKI